MLHGGPLTQGMTMGIHLRYYLNVLEHFLANLWSYLIEPAPFGGFMSTFGGLICTFEEDVDYLHMLREPLEAGHGSLGQHLLFLEEKPSLLGLFHCTCGLTTFILLCFRLLSCNFNFLS